MDNAPIPIQYIHYKVGILDLFGAENWLKVGIWGFSVEKAGLIEMKVAVQNWKLESEVNQGREINLRERK